VLLHEGEYNRKVGNLLNPHIRRELHAAVCLYAFAWDKTEGGQRMKRVNYEKRKKEASNVLMFD